MVTKLLALGYRDAGGNERYWSRFQAFFWGYKRSEVFLMPDGRMRIIITADFRTKQELEETWRTPRYGRTVTLHDAVYVGGEDLHKEILDAINEFINDPSIEEAQEHR